MARAAARAAARAELTVREVEATEMVGLAAVKGGGVEAEAKAVAVRAAARVGEVMVVGGACGERADA